jgi:hypothetical protein
MDGRNNQSKTARRKERQQTPFKNFEENYLRNK